MKTINNYIKINKLTYLAVLYTSLLAIITTATFASPLDKTKSFRLQNGDLLFQDLNCGKFCDSVDSVTYGFGNTYVSHVAMVISAESGLVIEARSQGVVITPLNSFLQRSLDSSGHPRVMVGRVKQQYQYLIPAAINYAKQQLGKPYNSSFRPNPGDSYYCSELIEESFKIANHNHEIFSEYPMNFTNGKDHKILPLWQDYYQQLGTAVPQGVLGTNPGAMSRESSIQIIYFYGKLRKHKY